MENDFEKNLSVPAYFMVFTFLRGPLAVISGLFSIRKGSEV